MKYCGHCGKETIDSSVFCDNCGNPFPNNQQQNFQQPFQQSYQQPLQQPYQQQMMYQHNIQQNKKNHTSLILGIAGIIFAWLFAIVGHILCITGIITGAKEYTENKNISGLAVSIVGELCAIISSLIGMVTIANAF